jgi:hypothetical protein
MWSPHCWQYAKPIGVAVPQRGQLIVPLSGVRSSGFEIAGAIGMGIESDAPQLRQNFIPCGFSPRHAGQIMGTIGATATTGGAATAAASALPQFRQNDAPGRLSWPQAEQRISPSCTSLARVVGGRQIRATLHARQESARQPTPEQRIPC